MKELFFLAIFLPTSVTGSAWCVKVCLCTIQYVPSVCMAVYLLLNVKENTFMLCDGV